MTSINQRVFNKTYTYGCWKCRSFDDNLFNDMNTSPLYVCVYMCVHKSTVSVVPRPKIHDNVRTRHLHTSNVAACSCHCCLLSCVFPPVVGRSGAVWRVGSEHLMMGLSDGALTRWAPPPGVMGVWPRGRGSIWAGRAHHLPWRRSFIWLTPLSALYKFDRKQGYVHVICCVCMLLCMCLHRLS